MRICYLDLNDVLTECYSVKPSKYGGGNIFAREAKQVFNNQTDTFDLYSRKESFENLIQADVSEHCHVLTMDDILCLQKSRPVKEVIPNAESYDIFVHHHSSIHLNLDGLKGKEFCWVIGYGENINSNIKNLGFFNLEYQRPIFQTNQQNIYPIIIGPSLPQFESYERKDYLFFCSRQDFSMGSANLVNYCLNNNIPLILGGKIGAGFEQIANYKPGKSCVEWRGELSQDDKIQLSKNARAVPILHQWPSPGSLLGVEAQTYGCPLIVMNIGWWPSYIKNGYNGFIINGEKEFVEAYHKSIDIPAINCYDSAIEFSAVNMITSFYKVFEQILK